MVMRRKDREILDLDKIESIIAGARYMHLGMFDENYPYVVPLHYGYEMKDGKFASSKTPCFSDFRRKNIPWSDEIAAFGMLRPRG